MNYKIGYKVKPLELRTGEVIFEQEDGKGGTETVAPNQNQCEAYGYEWNSGNRTCVAYNPSIKLERIADNLSNYLYGANNQTQRGVQNTLTMGESNEVKGNSMNNLIVGTNNSVARGTNNNFVFGVKAQSTTKNSINLGGNTGRDILGKRQMTYFMMGATTTTNGTVATNVNSEAGVKYKVPVNAVSFFHCDILAVRVGGTNVAGAVGDFGSWTETGVVVSKTGGEGSTINRQRKTLSSNGDTENWRPTAVVDSDGNFNVNVRGQTNMDIDWVITVRTTQLQTGVTIP